MEEMTVFRGRGGGGGYFGGGDMLRIIHVKRGVFRIIPPVQLARIFGWDMFRIVYLKGDFLGQSIFHFIYLINLIGQK